MLRQPHGCLAPQGRTSPSSEHKGSFQSVFRLPKPGAGGPATIDIKQPALKRVQDDIGSTYCMLAHVRGRVGQSMVQCMIDGGEKGGTGKDPGEMMKKPRGEAS
jgi:hypothetical protein